MNGQAWQSWFPRLNRILYNYTLGPQAGSTIQRNYLISLDPARGPSSNCCIYHDNGSGGFLDTENVCEGFRKWHDRDGVQSGVQINPSNGDFGPCGQCPTYEALDGVGGNGNCNTAIMGNSYDMNWFQLHGFKSKPGHQSCDNIHIGRNAQLRMTDKLPSAATAVIEVACPRY